MVCLGVPNPYPFVFDPPTLRFLLYFHVVAILPLVRAFTLILFIVQNGVEVVGRFAYHTRFSFSCI